MATSFLRQDSQNYQCSVMVGPKRVTGSTGTPDKPTARRIEVAMQNLADELTSGQKRTQDQLARFVGAVFDAAGVPSPLDQKSGPAVRFSEFAKTWLNRKHRNSKHATYVSTKLAIGDFQGFVDDKPLRDYTGDEIQRWLDALVKSGYAPNTISVRLTIIRAIFRHAQNLGIIRMNPAAELEVARAKGVINRQEFPEEVFGKVFGSLCGSNSEHAQDWCIAMMFGRFAGLRLRDAVRVRRTDYDKAKKILCYTALKTGRLVCIPIFPPLSTYLESLPPSDSPLFCPKLANLRANVLSQAFARIIDASGVQNAKTAVASGRLYSTYTFHGLRHARGTELARLGIPEELRMRLLDHTTVKASRGYDHSNAADLAEKLAQYFKT